jgi:GT2 family glycosyltransferase
VRFDESLPGFHYYDLDFTYSAFLAGFKLAVVNDIHAIHHSTGNFGQQWAQQATRFNEKWTNRMPPRPNRPLSFAGVTVTTREEIWEVVHPPHWNE